MTEKTLGLKLVSLREKLGQKAKQEPRFRFYTLYGLICRMDVLKAAWTLVYANRGGCGVDNVTFASILKSERGIDGFLQGIEKSLKEKTYRPQPVKRVYIPKPGGRKRPLGIPTIRDRIVQMAVLLILEPIFEQDFLDCSYGFRPGRSAHQVVEEIEKNLKQGYCEIYDADLQGYFDSIPHDKLMKCLEMRIADQQILKLIRKWLKTPIVETGGTGKKRIHSAKAGTPQGGVISPLLANLYLHWFDKVFHRYSTSPTYRRVKLLRYADDMVIMTKSLSKQTVDFIEEKLEKWMELEINKEKTQIVNMKKRGVILSFLGFSFRYDRSKFNSGNYLNIFPKESAIKKAREKIKELTAPNQGVKPYKEVIHDLNHFLKGWGQYFDCGYPSKVFSKLNYFVGFRLYRHLLRRSERRQFLIGKHSWYAFFRGTGLILLRKGMSVRAQG